MKVTLRAWKTTDATSLASALSNKKVLNNLRDGLPYPYTEKDALEYINFILASNAQETFAYAIDVDGTAVGSIGAFRQQNIHSRTAELGYYIAEEYWGRDIMTEAVRQLCEKYFKKQISFAFLQSPLHTISAPEESLKKQAFSLKES